MKRIRLSALCLLVLLFSGITSNVIADCGGMPTSRRQPVRNFFQKLRGSNVAQQSSCAGSMDQTVYRTATVDCTQLVQQTVQYVPVVQQTTYTPVVQPTVTYTQVVSSVATCPCIDCNCVPSVEQTKYVEQRNCTFGLEPQVIQNREVIQEQKTFGLTDAYSRAYQSAAYRAANRIKGHVRGELLANRASSAGVGFASNNPNPTTCLGTPGRTSATCAVVRGPDGWYSTCVRPN